MAYEPKLPIPISLVGGKYLLFDVDVISWLRKAHHICGVMGGTLPQSPSQNVFLGLPMQIMPEEAQLLVEEGSAYIVDDPRAHDQAIRSDDTARHAEYISRIRRKAEAASKIRAGQKDEQRKQALNKRKAKPPKKNKSDEIDDAATTPTQAVTPSEDHKEEVSLFGDTPAKTPDTTSLGLQLLKHMTPTTSHLFLPLPIPSSSLQVSNLPTSYPLYRHLNSKSYFLTPGLRFGCQYCVYPGDPLRFHSHFLAVGVEWDEEIDLMDIVGGGRLGTGVKKGFLIGGSEPRKGDGEEGESQVNGVQGERVRTFSVEWAIM